jgi:PAS domain S-box-containing protein
MIPCCEVPTRVLKQEEVEFCALLESVADAAYALDPSTLGILGRNRKAAELDGYSDDDIAHMTATDLYPREGHVLLREWLEKGPEAGGLLHLHSLLRKDGQLVPVEENQTLVGAGGEKVVLSMVRDLTDHKRAEDALMEERRLLHTLMDNLPDLIYFKDRESRFTRINLALAKKLDLGHPSQAIGKTDFDFLPAEHAEAFRQDDVELLRTGQPIVGKEEQGIWPDGHVTWLSTTKMALRDGNGNIIGTFGVSRDITDRKRAEEALRNSEEQFRQLAENIHEVFFIAEPDPPRITYLSPAYEEVWGRPRHEAYERADAWIDIIHPDDRERAIDLFSRSFQGEQASADYRIARPDGSVRYIKARAFPVRDAGGKFCRVVGIAEDVTAAERAEASMAERHRLATLVAGVGVALTQAESLRQGLQRCAEILARDIGAAFVRIWTVNEEESVLELQASAGLYTHIDGGHARVPIGKFKIGRIAESGEPHLTNSVQEDSWVGDPEWARQEGMIAFAGYPLKVEGRVLGVVAAFARQPFSNTTLQAVASVADNTAQFIKRKRAENELRLTQFSVEHASDAVFWMDTQGRIVYVNEAACRSLGRSREELLALSIPDIDPPIRKVGWGTAWEEVKAQGSRVLVTQHQTKEGRTFPVEVTANYLEFDGKEYSFAFARDITERLRAEEALRDSEERYRMLFQRNLAGVVRTTTDGQILECNQAMANILGFDSPQEARDRRALEFYFSDEERFTFLEKLKVDGRLSNFEMRLRREDGSPAWVIANVSLGTPAAGGSRLIEGTFIDITKRKLAEATRDYLASIVESSEDAIIGKSLEGIIQTWNHGAEKLYGYAASEVIGQSVLALVPAERHEEVDDFLNRIKHGERIEPHETVRVAKGGGRLDVSVTISPLKDARGEVVGASTVAHDITARKRAEQDLLFKTALLEAESETTIDGILVVDLAGRVLLANRQFARMWNIPEEALRSKDDKKLMEHTLGQLKDAGAFLERVNDLYAHASEKSRDEIELKDGRVFDRYSSPLQDPTGKLYGRIWYFRDISERRELERTKSEIVSVVSHELRTPLTSIRGALGLLAAGLLRSQPEKGERMLEIAVSNTDRLVRLINDILDLERLESGKMNLEKRTCTAAGLMTQAADNVRDLAEKAGVTLSVSLLSARLWVDPDRIIQALINLLSNAIKFSPRGKTVWLTARRQADQILFQVKDQGRGIPQEKRENIFERFQQVDASDRREKGGTGLGLPITRSIVQQHGGRIWVESTLGQGSTFTFALPSLPTETVMVGDSRAQKVLVCAVDADIFGAVQAVLSEQGYTLLAAASWQEAIDLASIESPDAVLVDSSMPDLDSGQAITALKRQSHVQDLPVIGLGGTAPDEVQLTARGMVGWVTTPFNQASLLPVLESVLSKLNEGPRVLVVEDDADLARVLTTVFERHGAVVLHARTGQEAVHVCPSFLPDLLVLDVILPELDGFGVVERLRQHEHLQHLPLAVYSVKELDDSEKARLRLGESIFMTKSRLTPQEFEQRAIGLLNWATSGQRERRRR